MPTRWPSWMSCLSENWYKRRLVEHTQYELTVRGRFEIGCQASRSCVLGVPLWARTTHIVQFRPVGIEGLSDSSLQFAKDFS